MPRTNGVYTLPPVSIVELGMDVLPQQHNVPLQDIAQALTNSMPRDGSAAMTGDLPMGGRKVTGLGSATAPGDAVRLDQLPATSGWLSSVAALTMAADRIPYATGVTTAALAVFTAAGRAIVGAADAAAQRVALGLGTLATKNKVVVRDIDVTGDPSAQTALFGNRWGGVLGVGQTWQAVSRTIGTNYQNTTGRPIQVSVYSVGSNTAVYVGSSSPANILLFQNSSGSGAYERAQVGFVVPAGGWYRIDGSAASVAELR